MPGRNILTKRQAVALFDLPTDLPSLFYHYILADDGIAHVKTRRGGSGRARTSPQAQENERLVGIIEDVRSQQADILRLVHRADDGDNKE